VAVILAGMEGISAQVFSVAALAGHVRLLVTIPLLFWPEARLDARMSAFVSGLVRTKIVPDGSLVALQGAIGRTIRWRESWLFEGGCLVLAILLLSVELPWAYSPELAAGPGSLLGAWYGIVCLTVFRFLILRWACRFFLWCQFLWSVGRLRLHLVPIHPDGAAGLGYLETVQGAFLSLVFALSAVWSACMATDLIAGRVAFEGLYFPIASILAVDAALILGPPFLLASRLIECRNQAMKDCMMEFAADYVNDFEQKWLGESHQKRILLGIPDLQSLADLTNSMNVVRTMRPVPISLHLFLLLVVAALTPMVPLLLLKYPISALVVAIFRRMLSL
jgi:hypothetical protein